MKKLLVVLLTALVAEFAAAQAPQKMTYQAVVRDASGNLVTSSNVGLNFNIRVISPTGTIVWTEQASATTNINGLLTYAMGSSIAINVDWSAGAHYLEVNMDPTGGTNYTVNSTTQLLSVPYALYAETAGNGGGSESDPVFTASPAGGITAGDIVNWNNDLVDDADADPSNEIQTLSLNGSDLTISSGNTITLPGSGSNGNTLDEAYDQGGAGAGRIITADAGAVEVNSGTASQAAFSATHSGNGVAIVANNSSSATTLPTIQASTASSSNTVSAIIGNSTGAAWGVSGQVESTATAEAAVYGNNLRTNGGYGLKGVGYNGAWGVSGQQTGAGIWGENVNTNGTGIAGMGNAQAPQVLALGSGGAFVANTTGLFAKYNTAGAGQGMTIQDNFGAQWTVGAWDGASYYKIAGTGAVSTIVKDLSNNDVIMTAPEAPEILFEDYGQGQLVNGYAHIEVDPIFAKNIVVNEEHPLRVFITLEGDCNGVFVTNKSGNGFDVKELAGGSSNVNFTYQVVANRADEEFPNGRISRYSDQRFQPAKPHENVLELNK